MDSATPPPAASGWRPWSISSTRASGLAGMEKSSAPTLSGCSPGPRARRSRAARSKSSRSLTSTPRGQAAVASLATTSIFGALAWRSHTIPKRSPAPGNGWGVLVALDRLQPRSRDDEDRARRKMEGAGPHNRRGGGRLDQHPDRGCLAPGVLDRLVRHGDPATTAVPDRGVTALRPGRLGNADAVRYRGLAHERREPADSGAEDQRRTRLGLEVVHPGGFRNTAHGREVGTYLRL